MRIILLGSPAFAVPTLEVLLAAGQQVVAVVSQPDRPAGRGHAPQAPALKLAALARGLTVLQPPNVNAPDVLDSLAALDPDVIVVAAFGQILRQRLLDLPRRGALNVHASLLPRHRGASPIAAAILAGDAATGVTIMEIVRALDAGPMVARIEEPISPSDTTGSLETRLALAGASLLVETLQPWSDGRLTPRPQDDALATYAPQLKREDALLDWSLPAIDLWRRVRAYNPWPVAFTRWRRTELRIWQAWPLDGDSGSPPGTVLDATPLPPEANSPQPTFTVQTGTGRLAVLQLQRAGGNALPGLDFLRGQRDLLGSRFES